jgi:hypothetical protein
MTQIEQDEDQSRIVERETDDQRRKIRWSPSIPNEPH